MTKTKVMCVQSFTKKNGVEIPDPTKDQQPQPGDIDFVLALYPANHPLNTIAVDQYTLERFGDMNGFATSHFIDVTDNDEAIVGTLADAVASINSFRDEITFRRRDTDGTSWVLKTYRLWKIHSGVQDMKAMSVAELERMGINCHPSAIGL